MSHYEIRFTGRNAKRDAMREVLNWFGKEKFRQVILALVRKDSDLKSARQFRFILSFAGVQGYPVHCLLQRFAPELLHLENLEIDY